MSIKVILFDLDGTLLPMDQDEFVKAYMGSLTKKMMNYGYEPNKLMKSVWEGTRAMVKNDGTKKNMDAFWELFYQLYGEDVKKDEKHFEEYYQNEFEYAKNACGYQPKVPQLISDLKEKYRLVLATNPLFPSIATQKRIGWAGLKPDDFEFYTTYENSYHCKPNVAYYQDILEALNVNAQECLMVGNDVSEDMIASSLGMKVFLLTDCLINKDDADISIYPHGNIDDLIAYINQL